MDLPPPGANALELAFRRLLLKCEEQAAGGARGVGGVGGGAAATAATATSGSGGKDGREPLIGSGVLLDWRVDPKFHCVSFVCVI